MSTKTVMIYLAAAVLLGGCRAPVEETAYSENENGREDAAYLQEKETPVQDETRNDSTPPRVEMTTSMGVILIELEPDAAPVTVANFLDYVSSGHYDGTVFHRIIPDFVIQGGGLDENLVPKPTRPPIVNESDNGLKNLRGTLSMARTSDINSATCQFFINLKHNASLDYPSNGGYAVFGRVVEGMDVVDQFARVRTGVRGTMRDVPLEAVLIESAVVLP